MLNLEIVMETNRTSGSEYPGRARQADQWLRARMRQMGDGRGMTATLQRDRRWRVEVVGEGGTNVVTGRTGTNEVTVTFVPEQDDVT